MVACHPARKATVRNKRPLSEVKPEYLLSKMDSAFPRFPWLNLKLSATLDRDEQSNSFTVNIRIRRDSLIWFSISSLGIEGIRGLVSRDSIKLMDRLNFKYLVTPVSALEKSFELPIDYSFLQAIILGEFEAYSEDSKLRSSYVDDDNYILSSLRKRKLKRSMEDKDKTKRVVQDIWLDPKSFRIIKQSIDDNKLRKKLIVHYDDFRELERAEGIPAVEVFYRSVMILEGEKPSKLSYEISRFLPDKEQEFPFTIPEKYEPMK